MGLFPYSNYDITSTESVTSDGDIIDQEQSLAYKIQKWSNEDGDVRTYLNPGIQSTNQQYLQSGGDFIRGLHIFYEVFVKGSILLSPTLCNFGMPKNMTFMFDILITFAYVIAAIQFVSGRQLEPAST